ncbi:MAG: GYF domain-containing protein, partial [Planctomycetia bacterium]
MADWYVQTATGEKGPFSTAKLTALVEDGKVPLKAMVRKDGGDWQSVKNFPELLGLPETAAAVQILPPANRSEQPIVNFVTQQEVKPRPSMVRFFTMAFGGAFTGVLGIVAAIFFVFVGIPLLILGSIVLIGVLAASNAPVDKGRAAKEADLVAKADAGVLKDAAKAMPKAAEPAPVLSVKAEVKAPANPFAPIPKADLPQIQGPPAPAVKKDSPPAAAKQKPPALTEEEEAKKFTVFVRAWQDEQLAKAEANVEEWKNADAGADQRRQLKKAQETLTSVRKTYRTLLPTMGSGAKPGDFGRGHHRVVVESVVSPGEFIGVADFGPDVKDLVACYTDVVEGALVDDQAVDLSKDLLVADGAMTFDTVDGGTMTVIHVRRARGVDLKTAQRSLQVAEPDPESEIPVNAGQPVADDTRQRLQGR